MSIKNVNKYKTFRNSFGQLHKEYSHEKADSEASAKWKEVKGKPDKIDELILKTKADLKEKESKVQRWAKFMVAKPKKSTSSTTSASTLSATSAVTTSTTTPTASSTTATTTDAIINDPERETPAQNKIKEEINALKDRIVTLSQLKEAGLSNADNVKQLQAGRKTLKEKELKLKNLIADSVRQRKRRSEKSFLIKELSSESEQARIKLQKFNNEAAGRPSLELTHPGLLDAIIQKAMAGAGADERRRSNILTSCDSLDGLLAGVKKLGVEDISWQSLYHRLVPR